MMWIVKVQEGWSLYPKVTGMGLKNWCKKLIGAQNLHLEKFKTIGWEWNIQNFKFGSIGRLYKSKFDYTNKSLGYPN